MVSPSSIYVGESLKFTASDAGFESVSVIVRGPTACDVNATLSGGQWSVIISNTGEWNAGIHRYEVWAVLLVGGKRLVEAGRIEVIASIGSQPEGSDFRSVARRNVEMLEAYLSGIGDPNSDRSVARYRINNRELENYSISDIRSLLDYWRSRLATEERKETGRTGRGRIVFHV